MVSASSAQCLLQVESSIRLYYNAITAIAVLSFVFFLVYLLVLQKPLQGAPALHAQCYAVFGSVKLLLGIILYLVFQPRCPTTMEVCHCQGLPLPLYPLFCVVLGTFWLKRGYEHYKLGKALAAQGLAGDIHDGDIIFERISNHDEDQVS